MESKSKENKIKLSHLSNVFTFCPKCGRKGFVFNGEKVLSCKACGLEYYMNPAPAVAAILQYPDGRIVLAHRKHEPRKGMLDLPGGFVDMNERIEDAVKREIFEELAVKVDTMEFIGSFPNEYVFNGVSYFTCDMAFVCNIASDTMLNAADDIMDALVIRPEDINFNEICFPSIVNILKLYSEKLLKTEPTK
jgi:ADP-ribose pyrophosphatase YjhB (NUDIX family)